MNSITIGRASSNDVVLTPQDISSQHARITDLGNGEYKVEDLDSSNGVYVNGYRIKTSNVSLDDQVRLSAKHIIDLGVLFKKKQGDIFHSKDTGANKTKSESKDYSKEFARLKNIYDEYYRDKKRIIEKNQQKQTLNYLLFMSIPVVAQAITGNVLISGATILFGGFARMLPGATKYLDKLEELNDNFMVRFVCPNKKCNQMLSGRSWNVWYNTGECPKCKAKFK